MLLVLVATLAPGQDEGPVGFCLLCAEGALSGFLLNIVLFVPLGMVLRWLGHRDWRVVAGGASLSAAIEVAQAIIPGRFASADDFLANTIGTALGVALYAGLDELLDPPRGRRARLALGAAALALLAQLLGALLVWPALSDSDYSAWYGPGTPTSGGALAGHVVAVSFDGRSRYGSRWSNVPKASARLLDGARIDIGFVASRVSSPPAPIFDLADDDPQLVLVIEGSRVVLRYRTVAEQLRLTPPQLWFREAMEGVQPADTVRLGVWRAQSRWCVDSPGHGGCRGFSTGVLWRVLAPGRVPDVLLIDALWMAALFLPIGYWGTRRSTPVLATVAALPMALLPFTGAGVVFSLYPVAGALAGLVGGRLHAGRRLFP